MIRVTRIQDVLDFDSGEMRSVMVLTNSAGLTAEVPLGKDQATVLVRLYESDDKTGGSPAPVTTVPQPAPQQVEAPLAAQPSQQQDGLAPQANVQEYGIDGETFSMTEVSYMENTPGETYDDPDAVEFNGGGVGQL